MYIDSFNSLLAKGKLEPETNAACSEVEVVGISIAISLKRIADMMEADRTPAEATAEDIEREPLMIIARAMEELSKPTLPPPASLHETAEREAKAIEQIRDDIHRLTANLLAGRVGIRQTR